MWVPSCEPPELDLKASDSYFPINNFNDAPRQFGYGVKLCGSPVPVARLVLLFITFVASERLRASAATASETRKTGIIVGEIRCFSGGSVCMFLVYIVFLLLVKV